MLGGPVDWWLGAVGIYKSCFAFEHKECDIIAPLCICHGQNGLNLIHFRG